MIIIIIIIIHIRSAKRTQTEKGGANLPRSAYRYFAFQNEISDKCVFDFCDCSANERGHVAIC
jgi:hypothetical protein